MNKCNSCGYTHSETFDCSQSVKKHKEKTEPIRTQLVMALVYALREAENIYLETTESTMKECIYNIVEAINFTEKERQLFEFESQSIGI